MLPLRGAAAVACMWRQTNRSSLTSSINYQNLVLKFPSCSPQTRTWLPMHQSGVICQIRAVSEAKSEPIPIEKRDKEQLPGNWKIKMLYDGDCPLCMREVNMLRERNKSYGTVKFVDISSEDYSPLENQGLDYKTVMGRIHAILSDGTVVTDVEAFRRLYEQVGLGWVYAITKYEPVASVADAIYGIWAKYRLQITGRPPLEEIMQTRKLKGEACSDKDSCKM